MRRLPPGLVLGSLLLVGCASATSLPTAGDAAVSASGAATAGQTPVASNQAADRKGQPPAGTSASAGGALQPSSATVAAASQPASSNFVLLELFTSEGCSSTPPAEAAVNRVMAAARAAGQPVYGLAFHVTYWDYLGWKDLYGSDANTARQNAYARALGHADVYTPEVVVNGSGDFPWADKQQTDAAIASQLAQQPPGRIALSWSASTPGGTASVQYNVTGAAPGTRLFLALAERGITVTPSRGENSGHRLAHGPVVRTLVDLDPGQGTATISIPADLNPANSDVIAFLQNPTNMAVSAAARLSLPANGSSPTTASGPALR